MSIAKEQEDELREVFNQFDKDKSGFINHTELKAAFAQLNFDATDAEIADLVKQMDTSNDGNISFDEFARVYGERMNKQISREQIKQVFDYFDNDSSGFISADELKNVFKALGKSYTPKQFDAILKKLDKDHTGQVSLQEFSSVLE